MDNSPDFLVRLFLKIRAPLPTTTVTNLLIARLLRFESAVDRLEKEIEVREIVQPVSPPWSNIISPCSSHYYVVEKSIRQNH